MGEFEDRRERVRARLIEVARSEGTITYGQLAPIADSEPMVIGQEHLDAISRAEVSEGRPMLSAVVVNAKTGLPGPGFFKLAAELGRMANVDSDIWFWKRERDAVYEAWKRPIPG